MYCDTALFRKRHLGYKIGLGCLLAGTVLYITGFATPNWCVFTFKDRVPGKAGQEEYVVKGRAGLWLSCSLDHLGQSHCDSISQSLAGWIVAVQGAQCLSILILTVCLLHVIYVNLLTSDPSPFCSRLPEAAIALAGGLALSGAVIYAIKVEQDKGFINDQDTGRHFHYDLSWSFVLSLMGSALFFLSFALVAIFNRPPGTPDSDKAFNVNDFAMPKASASECGAPGTMADSPEVM